jgi:hypothetical protein
MPASDYIVLQDGNKDLNKGEHLKLTVSIPPPSEFDERFSPILWFNVQPLTSHRLKFVVVVNQLNFNPDNIDPAKVVLTYDSPDDIRLLRGMHEVLPVSLFTPGNANTVIFFVADGSVRFADIVLCFHVRAF